MDIIKKHNIKFIGNGEKTMILAHGFGCNSNMWRHVIPTFEKDYRLLMFDHIGTGKSDMSSFHPIRYTKLQTYAEDFLEICHQLDLEEVVYVGHSVSASIGILAHIAAPELFSKMILVGPSPCYLNEGDYYGGFEKEDLAEIIKTVENNYLGWSSATAPAIMGNPERPELGEELVDSFCKMDPKVAEAFAKATFYADNRADLPKVAVPTLILQTEEDIIAPKEVGKYVHQNIPDSTFVLLNATGHLPHLSAPEETIAAMDFFLKELDN